MNSRHFCPSLRKTASAVYPVLLAAIFLTAILLPPLCAAQEQGTAALNGEVVDPAKALVSGAQVTATEEATGQQRATVTNQAGLFVINDLNPGDYNVRVTQTGFATYSASIHVEVGQQANLKVGLAVEAEKRVVEIIDDVQSIDTISSVVDGVVNAQQIENLPLNGRNFLELALLMPGNSTAPNFDPTKTRTVVISSAGQLGRGGSVTLDGMDNNDDAVGGMLLNLPEDAVQEFQVATNRFSAETGRSSSAVVNVVTKSGGNAVHGSASFYERDKAIAATPPTYSGAPTDGSSPPFRRQQFAGTIGGPLVRDKAWWFGAFEYRDEVNGSLVAERHPNLTGGGGTFSRQFAPQPVSDPLGTARADWQITDRDLLTLHYAIQRNSYTDVSPDLFGAPIGTASLRQDSNNHFQTFQASWTRVLSPSLLNRASFSFNNFANAINPVAPGVEFDYPSLADGASFDTPQSTFQKRFQWDDGLSWTKGRHNFRFGGQFQRVQAEFDLGVFRGGAVNLIQDFADFDHNGDGVINDQDLLFAIAIRSGKPTQTLIIPNSDNNYIAGYVQDDWHVHPQLTLNLGVRYEVDTDSTNVGHYNQINPILLPFLHGKRHEDTNNFGPRIGFNWADKRGLFSVHGGYGIYYDRIVLEVLSLERGLDGRALPLNVTVGNASFLDSSGHFVPGARPTLADPFSGPVIPGVGDAQEGINVIDNNIQNPMVQQFDLGIQHEFAKNWIVKVDGIHNLGTHFIVGVPLGSVPTSPGGPPESVTGLSSSANTHYDALWLTVDHRFAQRYQFHSAYTLSKASNYANYDQVPTGYLPSSQNIAPEYGPTPNDQRHRLVLQGTASLPFGFQWSPLWTYASGVPMDILLSNGQRAPGIGRNAGGRQFHNGSELNAYINARGLGLPNVSPDARFNDTFNSFDMRLSKEFRLSERFRLQAIGEVFNLANKTNVLGMSTKSYSGYFNKLVADPGTVTATSAGYSSNFGTPVSTAGGVLGSGGPRAFQLAAKLTF